MASQAGSEESGWSTPDLVYTCIMGVVMLAAFLEWFLWMAAFVYCLWKVHKKAEHWTINLLATIVGFFFVILRCIFLPIMLVTLPLPSQVVKLWPVFMVEFLQWFAFWSFAALLTVPWLFCVYQIVTNHIGRTKRVKQALDESSAPKVVIVMPCYKEDPAVLMTAVNSVVDCDYPASCIHVFLSFDGQQEDELYLNTIEQLGVPLSLESYPRSIDVTYKGARITVSRFPHGGKRSCQKSTYRLIDRVYEEYLRRNDNLFILFIDSDCILDRLCLQNFIYDMELSPGNSRDMLAMTGVITSTTKKHSLITLLQDMEYIHGQLFERTVESGCGAVTCLPGALTMLRFSAFRRMAKYYFADKAEQCEDLFDFAKCHLGEDRWLTHLFMIGAKKRYQIQMCTTAFCKTEAVQDMTSLVKQRRRWFLGFITNEVCMLTDWRLWKRYPILILVRFMQNTIRTTALLFFIMVIALMSTSKKIKDLPVGFIGISLGLNWLMMMYFGFKLRRFKIWLYPLMFILNPFFNWYYMVYGIFTAGQRTWGGPRVDAAAADHKTTAQQAIEAAEKSGDDLNVIPESFMTSANERRNAAAKETESERDNFGGRPSKLKVRPPNHLVGKFAARRKTEAGTYTHMDEKAVDIEAAAGTTMGMPSPLSFSSPTTPTGASFVFKNKWALQSRDSLDSAWSGYTGANSIYMPRRVESIMGDEDRRKYEMAMRNSRRISVISTASAGGSALSIITTPTIGMSGVDYFGGGGGGGGGEDGGGLVYQQQQRSGHERHDSDMSSVLESMHSHSRAASPETSRRRSLAPLISPLLTSPSLAPPQSPYLGPRSGRSPLGRASLMRTSTVIADETSFEMVEGLGGQPSPQFQQQPRQQRGRSPFRKSRAP